MESEKRMSPEVRRAALLAAAKTTFIVSLGCSSNVQPGASRPESVTPPAAPEVSCAEHLGGLAQTKMGEALPASDPLHDKPGVYGAFTDIAARTSERTQQCCSEALTDGNGESAYRWACCSALIDQNGQRPDDRFMACTPWGPPCPPALLV